MNPVNNQTRLRVPKRKAAGNMYGVMFGNVVVAEYPLRSQAKTCAKYGNSFLRRIYNLSQPSHLPGSPAGVINSANFAAWFTAVLPLLGGS